MSWIRECTLVGTQGSRKEQLLKDKFDAFLNHRSPDVLLTEFLPQVRTSVDAFLGFMGIFTKYYLDKLVEAKKLDNKLLGLIIESSIVAHGHLLKWKNPRKLEYSFKLFNKLIRRLNADEKATVTKMLKSVLGKKDNILALNWTLCLLGSNKPWDTELNTQRFKVLTGTFFEEQKPNAFASGVLPNIALRSVTANEFKTEFLEEFGNLYRRNSSNVGRVLEFYSMFGKRFFARLDEAIVKEAMNPRIFEALGSKTEEVVAAAVDSVRFFAALGKPGLTDHIAQHSFNGIGERKLEAIKVSGLQIILASKVSASNQTTTKALYKLLDNVLEGIKSEEGVAKVFFKLAAQIKTLSQRLGDLAVLPDLLVPKGEELNVSFRFILAAAILDHCKPAESAAHFEAAKSAVSAVYDQYVKKTVVENANRLRMNNLEVLAGSLFVAKFSTVSGLLPELKQKIVEAYSAKDLEYYTEGFSLTNPTVHKKVLLELLCLIEANLEYPSKVHDVVIAALSADASFKAIEVLKPYKLTSNFAVAFCRGLRILKDWNWRKDRIRTDLSQIFEKVIPAIFERDQPLEVEDAHSICDVVCGQSSSNRVPDMFAKFLVQKHHLFKSLLSYPLDMVNPINHHYLGSEGLFSLYQDRLFYYQHYVRFLSVVDLDIIFTHASIFYNPTDLKDLKLVQSRNSMVGNRSLELEDFSFKDKYKEVLETLNFLKKEKKAPAAGAGKKKGAQQQAEETVSRTREIKVDFQLLGDMEMKLIKHDAAYKNYSYILKRLSDSAALAFGDIMGQTCPRSAELMDQLERSGLFLKLRLIAKETPLLRDAIKQLICAILKGLVLNLSHKDFGDKFSALYFEVIASDRAAQLNRLLEESLDVLSTVKDESAMHPAVVPILEDFSRFCFEAMFDADARRKSFDVIISMASKVKSSFLCDFIRDHLDDLYFDDVPALLNKEIESHGKTRPDILSGFLLKLLDFQFKAQSTLLSSMLELEASALAGQTIGNFEIIKLIILTKGEMKDVAQLAQAVLDRAGKKLDYHNIIELDFLRMVREIPFDLHLIAGKIISDAVASLNLGEQKGFFQQVIKSCQSAVSEAVAKVKLYEEHPAEESYFVDVDAAEETLGIYPVLLGCLSPHWPADLLESLFDTLVDLENNHLPNLTEKLCSTVFWVV